LIKLNPGQLRKIRIIEKHFGANWREDNPGIAVDALYNRAIQDDRKPLFCKIDAMRKARLSEMIKSYNITMAELISAMIDVQYDRYTEQQRSIMSGIAADYSGGN
jgi:hypothetical protein